MCQNVMWKGTERINKISEWTGLISNYGHMYFHWKVENLH